MATLTKEQALAAFSKHNVDGNLPGGFDRTEGMAILSAAGKTELLGAFIDRLVEHAKSAGKAIGRKTECQLTSAELAAFVASGATLELDVFGTRITCEAKQFSTGSVGFGGTAKAKLVIAGKTVTLQCTPNFTIIGSGMVK